MSMLEVNPEGLNVLAAHCGVLASELAQSIAPASDPAGHAAAAAVQDLHSAAGLAGAAMAARLQEVSAKLVRGGALFSNREVESADQFEALPPTSWM